MTETKKIRAFRSNFTIRVGPLALSGKLLPVQKTQKEHVTHMCTPTNPPKAVKQVWKDVDGQEWPKNELLRYKEEDDGKWTVFDPADVEAAKESALPKDIFTVTVHPAKGLDAALYPSSETKSYMLVPNPDDPTNAQIANLLVGVLEKGKFGMMGIVNMGGERVYRLIVWRGNLVIQPQTFTDALNDHNENDPKVTKAETAKGHALLEKLAVEFDAENYTDKTKAKIAAVIQGGVDAEKIIKAAIEKAAEPEISLIDLLESALEGV